MKKNVLEISCCISQSNSTLREKKTARTLEDLRVEPEKQEMLSLKQKVGVIK